MKILYFMTCFLAFSYMVLLVLQRSKSIVHIFKKAPNVLCTEGLLTIQKMGPLQILS